MNDIVIRQIISVYRKHRDEFYWTLQEYINVLTLFYESYRAAFGEDHPRLRNETILEIMRMLPGDGEMDYTPDAYPELIDAYFDTDFDQCDYCMRHFVSGDIRLMRFYERLY